MHEDGLASPRRGGFPLDFARVSALVFPRFRFLFCSCPLPYYPLPLVLGFEHCYYLDLEEGLCFGMIDIWRGYLSRWRELNEYPQMFLVFSFFLLSISSGPA